MLAETGEDIRYYIFQINRKILLSFILFPYFPTHSYHSPVSPHIVIIPLFPHIFLLFPCFPTHSYHSPVSPHIVIIPLFPHTLLQFPCFHKHKYRLMKSYFFPLSFIVRFQYSSIIIDHPNSSHLINKYKKKLKKYK